MAEQGKKVEVRFGAFSCSIEGYDNPVEQMREVLGMMQRMIAETPQLAEADPAFDADQLESALARDGSEAHAGPGVVVIRSGENEISTQAVPQNDDPAEEADIPMAEAHEDDAGVFDPYITADALQTTAPVSAPEAADSASEPYMAEAQEAPWRTETQDWETLAAAGPGGDTGEPDVDETLDAAVEEALEGAVEENVPAHASTVFEPLEVPGSTDDQDPKLGFGLDRLIRERSGQELEILPTSAESPDSQDASAVDTYVRQDTAAATGFGDEAGDYAASTTAGDAPDDEAFETGRPDPFADPDPEPEPASQSGSAGFSIFAAPAAAIAGAATSALGGGNAAADRSSEPASTDPEPDAVAMSSIFAPPSASDPEPTPEPAPEPDQAPAMSSIFAPAPPQDAAQPEIPGDPSAQAQETSETPGPTDNDRFTSLLSKVQNSAQMGAPGEASNDAPAEERVQPDGPSASELATMQDDPTVAGQLAASAAWLTLVKRQHRFSRREVMEVLEGIPAEQPRSLADRIKGFGKLVRSGHLVLIDDGVFALAQPQRDHFQGLMSHP